MTCERMSDEDVLGSCVRSTGSLWKLKEGYPIACKGGLGRAGIVIANWSRAQYCSEPDMRTPPCGSVVEHRITLQDNMWQITPLFSNLPP